MGSEFGSFLERFPEALFDTGDTLIANTFRQEVVRDRVPRLAYLRRGFVRGAWNRGALAPEHRATVVLAGDGQWIGVDAFKYGENLFRYTALEPTTAHVMPLGAFLEQAPREVLVDALRNVSLTWYTAAAVHGLAGQPMERRLLLLLYDLRRRHPRPDLRVSQKVLGELMGVSRQALNRVIKVLEGRGLLSVGYGHVVIPEATPLLQEGWRAAQEELSGRAESGEPPTT